ncbi:MAG TPA: T9SS type A sorting domain-containing protein [Bacteroidota bacterium]|nr:T9SS type A sorting domain-containing protein [Bacteroidota bacterium]
MKSRLITTLLLVVFLVPVSVCQVVQFRVPLVLQWGTKLDTLYVGVNSGNGNAMHANSYGLDDATTDSFGPLGMYGETGAAPPDPDGNRVRFIDIPGRTELGAAGGLFKYDYRGFTSSAQADTFVIEVAGAIVEGNDLKVSWPANVSRYASGWTINSRTPSAIGGALKNMLDGATEYTFAATGNPVRFAVVKVGANAVAAVKELNPSAPARYLLEQNYPNPFNPSTEIRFSMAQAGYVTIRVFDLLGRNVADVVEEHKAPGSYSVRFDASRLASGFYFYRMESGAFTSVRRMAILK